MPQIINTNIASLNAQRNLNKSQSANQTALQRLSSGLRINSAKDDAAGLAISTRFNSQIRGLNVAVRNAGDGISLAQTAEGALGTMNDNLQRIRELAVQSANATNSDVDREALQAEVTQLIAEVSRTADETAFNGRNLLDGSFSATFQIGANAGQTLDVTIAELTAEKLGAADSAGLSAVGNSSGLENGDLIINGVAISPSKAEDDNASFKNNAASSIAKVAAINEKYDETGVKAYTTANVVSGEAMTAVAQTGSITLNGVSIDIQTTSSAATSRASVVESINAYAEQTGITASDSGDDANGVTLTAADGRNITLTYTGVTSAATGLVDTSSTDTFEGGFTLVADGDVREIDIKGGDGTGNGNIANAGLKVGTYDTGTAQLASSSVSSTSGVGFENTAFSSQDLFGLSGGLLTTDAALNMIGSGGTTIFGTVAEVITVQVGTAQQVMNYTSANMGADTLASALNALGVDVSAETKVRLDFSAALAGGAGSLGSATTYSFKVYDTNTANAALGTITISSGQTLEQTANSINASFSSIVATFDTANGYIYLTDTEGNTLAINETLGAGTFAVNMDVAAKDGTFAANGAAVQDIGAGSVTLYAVGYIKDVNVTDSSLSQVTISSNRAAALATLNVSTFFSRGSADAVANVATAINSLNVDVSTSTFGLEDGDLVINDIAISAANTKQDTATATLASDGTTIQSSLKEKSAIAIAAAINNVSEDTGVTAMVNETVVVGSDGSTYSANQTSAEAIYSAGDSGKIYINGIDVGVISLQDDGTGAIDKDASRQSAIDAINQKAGLTGVTAEDNGESITLRAADGRNISIAIDNDNNNNGASDPAATGFGALIGLDASIDGIGEADIGTASSSNNIGVRGNTTEGAAYETTYGTLTLSSAKEIDISAGTSGKADLSGIGFTAGKFGGGENGQFLTEIDISTFEGATAALTAIDNAIGAIASQRANLGAIQNRIESTVNNLSVTSENLSAANSRIQDADFAAETAELSRTQVLQQAGISILAQANQGPQQVLSLLG
ncbi:MAG: hypothetical protein HWE39_12980 [Oceanospirillaceae bacterium]|nr:hypothetical protein [Oceanospirillaceae bacterium]